MSRPDQRLFEADVASAAFRIGVETGRWGLAEAAARPESAAWPQVYLWMAAAPRPDAPSRYYVSLNAENYRTSPPTGTFWDPVKKTTLAFAERPKGKASSRFAKVFRTDWEGGRAFYHPYDRHGLPGHPMWASEQPHLVWSSTHTIVDYLEEFQSLLMSPDYVGR